MSWPKWVLLAFFVIGVAVATTEAIKSHRWGANKARNEAAVSAAILAGLAALVVIA